VTDPRRLKVLGHTRFHFVSEQFKGIRFCNRCFCSDLYISRTGKKCKPKRKFVVDNCRCSKCGADIEETYTARICQGCGDQELNCECEKA
jgi:hypothetical protein